MEWIKFGVLLLLSLSVLFAVREEMMDQTDVLKEIRKQLEDIKEIGKL